jgi:hypothetical protein
VRVDASTLQAVTDGIENFGTDEDTLATRLSVARLLYSQANEATAAPEDEPLLTAYRDWLSATIRYYTPQSDATERDYVRSAAIMMVEVRLAQTRDDTTDEASGAGQSTRSS